MSFYFLLGSRYALIISFKNNNNNKKGKKTFFECFFSGIIFFLKRRVKNPGRAHSSLRNVAPCAHLNGDGKRESTQSSERWWRFNLPPRSWQMLQSCRVSSFNFLFSLFKKNIYYIFSIPAFCSAHVQGAERPATVVTHIISLVSGIWLHNPKISSTKLKNCFSLFLSSFVIGVVWSRVVKKTTWNAQFWLFWSALVESARK